MDHVLHYPSLRSTGRRPEAIAVVVGCALFCVAAVLLLAACGGDPEQAVYSNDDYGFSLRYDDRRFVQTKLDSLTKDPNSLFSMSLRDNEAGYDTPLETLDKNAAVGVTVFRGVGTTPAAAELEAIARTWNRKAPRTGPSDAKYGKYTVSELAGKPCLVREGSFVDGGNTVITRDYMLFTADYWYGVHMQANEVAWPAEEAPLQAVAETLGIGG
jgi:hypothetical protein